MHTAHARLEDQEPLDAALASEAQADLELSSAWDGGLSFHCVPSPCPFQRGWESKLQ